MNSVGSDGQPAWHKRFNNAIFSDSVNVINVKLCMIILLIELFLVTPLSVTLIITSWPCHAVSDTFN